MKIVRLIVTTRGKTQWDNSMQKFKIFCSSVWTCFKAKQLISGKLMDHFPLAVWQTGSGTQSNMNSNEVIANRGNEIAGKKLLHPNDHINMSQSSNDTFPTALHIAAAMSIEDNLFPAMDKLTETLKRLESENEDVVKSGRTHLQDAVPIRFSQEISGWRNMLEKTKKMLEASLPGLKELALGGTAVGTGLNAPKNFGPEVAKVISELTGKEFVTAENKFHALTAKDDITFAHGALKALAADLMKIANDVRWLASGPRCGLGEINSPLALCILFVSCASLFCLRRSIALVKTFGTGTPIKPRFSVMDNSSFTRYAAITALQIKSVPAIKSRR